MEAKEYLLNHENDKLRIKNIETILKYVNSKGDDRLNRWQYFTEDGQGGYTGPGKYDNYDKTEDGVPGHQGLRFSDEWNYKFFPDFHFEDNILLQTQDPNYYVVVSKGVGFIDFPAYEKKPYSNYFFHTFEMENGKIKRYREHMNFCEVFHTLGIELPEVKFPGK